MVANTNPTLQETPHRGLLPPWSWFWLILYILGLPNLFATEKTNFLILVSGKDGTTPVIYGFVERWVQGGVVLNDLILLISVLAVFLPWFRTAFLEKRYELADITALPPLTLPITHQSLGEIHPFVQEYAPDIILKYSPKNLRDYAFIYPIGYGLTGMALSARILALWRNDRQTAQATLLHEIAHYRHGDAFVTGTGSPLKTVVNYLIYFNIAFIVLPVCLSFILDHVNSFREEMAITSDLQTIISFHFQQIFTIDLPSLSLAVFQSLARTAATITLVLAAIWCAELNADRFVMDTTHSTQVLTRIMQQQATSTPWQDWMLSRMSHPPRGMRLWLVRQSQSTGGLVLFLLLFPAAWFIRLVFLLGWALGNLLDFLYTGVPIESIGTDLGIAIFYYLEALVPAWITITILFLLWPYLARFWERLFARTPGQRGRGQGDIKKYNAYLLSASLVACVCILGIVLSLLPGPTTAAATSGTTNKPHGHFQVGTQVTVANIWLVKVVQAQIHPNNGFIKPKPGNAFLAINVSLKNISSQTYTFSSAEQFTLQDLQGTKYDQTFVTPFPPPELSTPAHNGRVAANASIHGQLTYEIPLSVQRLTLSFKADWQNYDPTSSQLTVWDINLASTHAFIKTGSPSLIPKTSQLPIGDYPRLRLDTVVLPVASLLPIESWFWKSLCSTTLTNKNDDLDIVTQSNPATGDVRKYTLRLPYARAYVQSHNRESERTFQAPHL